MTSPRQGCCPARSAHRFRHSEQREVMVVSTQDRVRWSEKTGDLRVFSIEVRALCFPRNTWSGELSSRHHASCLASSTCSGRQVVHISRAVKRHSQVRDFFNDQLSNDFGRQPLKKPLLSGSGNKPLCGFTKGSSFRPGRIFRRSFWGKLALDCFPDFREDGEIDNGDNDARGFILFGKISAAITPFGPLPSMAAPPLL